ncbi:hypothetical protein HD554DRAFT_2168893 [Boletus coccyginus]|nr:hypothetical protein HD554DRAFT_2168893 [Boletus coccyginus]
MLNVPDGVYRLHNDQDLNLVADLTTGGPGPIDGITGWNAHNDKARWSIKNVGQGEDSDNLKFTIESVGAPGIYAYAEPKQGAPVVGSPHASESPIVWTLFRGWCALD